MDPEDDQDGELRLRWPLSDVIAASLAGFRLRRAGRAESSEEWPEVVLEDILDAEVVGE